MHLAIVFAALSCNSYGDAERWPPPVLPAALAEKYPSGAATRITVRVDAAGRPLSAKSDFGTPVLREMAVAWAKRVTYSPPAENCKSVPGTVTLDMRFFPPSNSIAALPPVVGAVNFDKIAYGSGPCAQTEFQPSVDDVFSGRVNGAHIAVVVLRCDFPVGFNAEARAYRIDGNRAMYMANVGTFALPAPDDPYVDGGWIHVNFASGALYVDTWDYFRNCDSKHDWETSTYTVRQGKLIRTYRERHHRSSVAVACER